MEADELGTFDLDGGVTGVSHSDLLDDALTLLGGQQWSVRKGGKFGERNFVASSHLSMAD